MRLLFTSVETEPFAQLWGTGKYYDELYADKI